MDSKLPVPYTHQEKQLFHEHFIEKKPHAAVLFDKYVRTIGNKNHNNRVWDHEHGDNLLMHLFRHEDFDYSARDSVLNHMQFNMNHTNNDGNNILWFLAKSGGCGLDDIKKFIAKYNIDGDVKNNDGLYFTHALLSPIQLKKFEHQIGVLTPLLVFTLTEVNKAFTDFPHHLKMGKKASSKFFEEWQQVLDLIDKVNHYSTSDYLPEINRKAKKLNTTFEYEFFQAQLEHNPVVAKRVKI